MRHIAAEFVPCQLNDDQKQNRLSLEGDNRSLKLTLRLWPTTREAAVQVQDTIICMSKRGKAGQVKL